MELFKRNEILIFFLFIHFGFYNKNPHQVLSYVQASPKYLRTTAF